jgi:pSer/pThr/pTyr-binding forkhead associated (FHA) protein
MESPAGAHAASPAELRARLEAERSGTPFLLWRDRSGQRILSLASGTERFAVGRGEEAELRLTDDEEVSRIHAEIERIGGEWTISDDGLSRNGSFLNGERVAGRRRLRDDDELRFGSTLVVFRAPATPSDAATVASREGAGPAALTETQRRILVSLCRPFRDGSRYATPPTNQEVADEVFLSVDAVKGHLRVLFERFGLSELPPNAKRVRLVELALQSGLITMRELDGPRG